MRRVMFTQPARPTEDGAGVKLKRVFDSRLYHESDPFIMLDEFGSTEADDYIAGFPPHPHKGFDTLTFMLKGRMTHEDSSGNRGEISDYGVQWMQTGRGIIHSEMPAQNEGEMRGMQFWLNIPHKEKSKAPNYLDYKTEAIPYQNQTIRLVAGEFEGYKTPYQPEATDILILHLKIESEDEVTLSLKEGYTAMIYSLNGALTLGDSRINSGELGLLSKEGALSLKGEIGGELMIISGKPLKEPMVQHGPFVMGSDEEIRTAFAEYRAGKLGRL